MGESGSLAAPAQDTAEAPPGAPRWISSLRPGPDQLALWVFIAFVAVAGPVILFHLGAYHWFFRDDFVFLADRQGKIPDLLEPHGGAHWVAVPRLIYLVLWQVFGLTSYVPYQACVVAYHLAVAVLVRVVMRRAGVTPWLATAAAGVMVLFGPGAQNIVWAFQVSFTGSLAWGLAHLLLADHEGGFDRRDALGLLAGLLAVASSGVGVTMVAVVGLATLLRRGWRMALVHTVPLGLVYGAWTQVADVSTTTAFGRPTPAVLAGWVRSTEIATFLGIGHFTVVAVVLVAVLAVGMVLAWGPWRTGSLADARRRMSMPVALFLGALLFSATSGLGRWWSGEDAARASRYVYLGAALSLPLLAVAAQAVASRWRVLAPAMVGLFLLPIPFNLGGFDPPVFGPHYMDQREDVLTTAVRMPFAYDVPADVQPLPDPFASDAVTMGFLLSAARNGDLDPSTRPIGALTMNEFRVRLGVAAGPATALPSSGCRPVTGPLSLSPAKGDVFVISGPVGISTAEDGEPTGPVVDFAGGDGGNQLTIELDDLELQVTPKGGQAVSQICPQS